MTQKMNLHISDVHCGQKYSQYGESCVDRINHSNKCIKALNRFQRDHRAAIGDVFIAGDLCQRTGLRAYDPNLESDQLKALGEGFNEHTGNIVYVAGSADPYMDAQVIGHSRHVFSEIIRQNMKIDRERLHMPGLSYSDQDTNTVVWHGHLRELGWNPDNLYDYLLNQRNTPDLFDEEGVIRDLRQNEDTHQAKGVVYEAGYRKIISKLPSRIGRFIDRAIISRDRKNEKEEIRTLHFPVGTTLYMGHTHSPNIDQLDNGVVIANSGSVTGAFRMDPEAEGSFITASETDDKQSLDLWNIDANGEYRLKNSTVYAKV